MAISLRKTLKILAVFFVVIAVAFSAPAKSKKKKKNKNNGLPKVEVCRINKKGKEICKMRVLKGKRAIIWLYEELIATNAKIAKNTELIDQLSLATQDLQTSLIDLEIRVSSNEGSIAANQQGFIQTGTWNKWHRLTLESAWISSNEPYYNVWGVDCDGLAWSLCSNWGIGGNFLAILPNRSAGDETYSQGFNNGDGYTRILVAKQ